MHKLYALETDTDVLDNDGNTLLIDKVLKYSKTSNSESAINVTADVIKRRQELKKEIQDKLNDAPPDTPSEDSSSPDETKDNESQETKDNESQETDVDSGGDKTPVDDSEETSKKKDETKPSNDDKDTEIEQDDDTATDSVDGVNSLIGSALKDNKPEPKNKPADAPVEKETEAKESYRVTLENMFNPIKYSYNTYHTSLESFGSLQNQAVKVDNQPVAYIKDSVVESLNNIITMANTYIGKNKTFIDSYSDQIKGINEKLTVYREYITQRNYHLTNKLVTDQQLLVSLSVTDKSAIRDTIKILLGYLTTSNSVASYILNNDFANINTILTSSDFTAENDDQVYKYMLPGFNVIRTHIGNYSTYLKTDISGYHYYVTQVSKASDAYSLQAISLKNDNDVDNCINGLDKLLVDLSITDDSFNLVNSNFNTLIDELKVLNYDVGSGKYTNLPELNIDSKIKDFIKFKLISEIYYINMMLVMKYLQGMLSVLDQTLELKS